MTYDLVELRKLGAMASPLAETPEWSAYNLGQVNATSLPVDYVLVGYLISPPTVGGQVRILRVMRNGVAAVGEYTSTEVTRVTQHGFTSRNSVYQLRRLADPDEHSPLGERMRKQLGGTCGWSDEEIQALAVLIAAKGGAAE